MSFLWFLLGGVAGAGVTYVAQKQGLVRELDLAESVEPYFSMEGLPMRLPQKQGQQVQYTAHGRTLVVKRTPNRSFFLKIVGLQHGRWADFATDARHDIQYFLDTGALPRSGVMY